MFLNEQLQSKWKPLLEAEGLDQIKDPYKRAVTAQLLENQERFLREERAFISEAAPNINTQSGVGGYGAWFLR